MSGISGGRQSFVLSTGKTQGRVTIGRYPIMALAAARKIAGLIKAERAGGRHQTPRIAFGQRWTSSGEQHLAKLARPCKKEIERLLTKSLGHRRAKTRADITPTTSRTSPTRSCCRAA